MSDKQVILLLIIGTIVIVLFALAMLATVLIHGRKRNVHYKERERLQRALIEERERTMNEISYDIHNHISQVVSFSQMILKAAMESETREEAKVYIEKVNDMLCSIGDDLQIMGKSLSCDYLQDRGLLQVLDRELEYIRSAYDISCRLEVEGESKYLDPERSVLIYRIVQEAVNNTLKHAKASEINLLFRYEEDNLYISVSDNGIGLPDGKIPATCGTGIANMRQRARLLNASLNITSENNKGMDVSLSFCL